jgi:hypothetical protein
MVVRIDDAFELGGQVDGNTQPHFQPQFVTLGFEIILAA